MQRTAGYFMLDLMCFLMKAEETKKQLGVLNNAVLHNNNKYMQAYIQKCTFSPKRSRESSKKIFNSCLAFLFAIKGIMIHKLMTIFFALFLFFLITFFVIIQHDRLLGLVFTVRPPSPLYLHFIERPEPCLILPYFFTGFPVCGVGGVAWLQQSSDVCVVLHVLQDIRPSWGSSDRKDR